MEHCTTNKEAWWLAWKVRIYQSQKWQVCYGRCQGDDWSVKWSIKYYNFVASLYMMTIISEIFQSSAKLRFKSVNYPRGCTSHDTTPPTISGQPWFVPKKLESDLHSLLPFYVSHIHQIHIYIYIFHSTIHKCSDLEYN